MTIDIYKSPTGEFVELLPVITDLLLEDGRIVLESSDEETNFYVPTIDGVQK